MNTNSGVYKLVFDNSPAYYIGGSSNLKKRFSEHIKRLRLGIHPNKKLQDAFAISGIPKLVVCRKCKGVDILIFERKFIRKSGNDPNCCNVNLKAVRFKDTDTNPFSIKMKQGVLERITYDKKLRELISTQMKKSVITIKRYCDKNDIRLTMASVLEIIRRELNVTDEQIFIKKKAKRA